MKRRFILLFTLLSIILTTAVAFANYPDHLNDDPNYILVDGHQGIAWYVDRSSVCVEKYEPPIYIISVDVARAHSATGDEMAFYERNGAGTIMDVEHYRFFYNYQATQMLMDMTGNQGWRYLPPLGSWAEIGVSMPAGEMAFYLAYGLKFYGAHTWSGDGLKDINVFSDSLYNRAK